MKKVFMVSLALLWAGSILGQPKVAVYISGGTDAGVNKILGDQLVAAFSKSGKYAAIERTTSFLAELSKEHSYQRSGEVSEDEFARLGRQFGVQLVCVAEVTEAFGEKYVSARLIDAESAEVVNAANASSSLSNMNELLSVSQKLTTELTGKTAKEKVEEAEKTVNGRAEQKAKNSAEYYVVGDLAVALIFTRKVDYKSATTMATSARYGGLVGWRLPTKDEADVVVENCKLIWGAGSPDGFFWTRTIQSYGKSGPEYFVTCCGCSPAFLAYPEGFEFNMVLVRTL